ncbi:5'-methylthioadenosine/adenosylhomocysteine nucleosidase [Nitrosomonas eutropha]|uniref:adenosylhomocysteine nucleosidase n=2 Tax=Nitrosomonas eutropha TaxID=916 RepID=A0ABX5M471_9PROT|nr:5'-methylthioadenosine/adenosylhomocysteine nucleosidase [Nitrosomonas eutropha]ABI60118.1 methylthioadenosine nucleosidase [Nitrosomonas eutropha C91]PXV76300.1 methylthioadenosine nucleosidase /adenosylhomocysteine nucleosidase [Nitrosomonas eutropha]SCX27959.1 methylthioadenosine nucleosidase /adenosylhomocysteine nucleosidase [Nitrosomonas eutropha]SEJ18942.1 methylthioadenosine nucleosidase /adenosylhomocysteine nucleosidase [Nitrosomonas eutropha]
MTTAILSALPEEQGGLVQALEQREQFQYAGRVFWRGRLHGQTVVLGLSGIGKVAAATTAVVLFERLGAQRIVFTGVAGGMGEGVQVGDVVIATQFLQHDMDASPIFPRWEVPGYGCTQFACDPELSTLLFAAAHAYLTNTQADIPRSSGVARTHLARVHQGLIVSGDRFVSTLAESIALRTTLAAAGHQALAVEMEGAAVAQVCSDFGKPFAAVRTISDRADDSAHIDFPRFICEVARPYADHIIAGFLQRQLVGVA